MKKKHVDKNYCTEEELRAFLKCSEFYKFGGTIDKSIELIMLENAIKKVCISMFRDGSQDPVRLAAFAIEQEARRKEIHTKMLEPEIDKMKRKAMINAHSLMKTFPFNKYKMVNPAMTFKTEVQKVQIELDVTAIFESNKNKSLHFIDFIPNFDAHAMAWDIPAILKAKYLSRFVPKSNLERAVDVQGHLFSVNTNNELIHVITSFKKQTATLDLKIAKLFRRFAKKEYMPLVPCPYACKFKKKCYPETTK